MSFTGVRRDHRPNQEADIAQPCITTPEPRSIVKTLSDREIDLGGVFIRITVSDASTRLRASEIYSLRLARSGTGEFGGLLSRPYLAPRREVARNEADDATAEEQHAKHEDDALNDGDPGAELGQVMLHRRQKKGSDHRAEHGAEPADEGHQHDPARHRPLDVGQRGELEDERLQRPGEAGQPRGENKDDELVMISVIAERDRARLVFADRLDHLAERRVDRSDDDGEA